MINPENVIILIHFYLCTNKVDGDLMHDSTTLKCVNVDLP